MTYKAIEIEYPNGRRRTYSPSDFDYYAATNELEHKSENIIITLSDLCKSFTYEEDEQSGEMTDKELLAKVELYC